MKPYELVTRLDYMNILINQLTLSELAWLCANKRRWERLDRHIAALVVELQAAHDEGAGQYSKREEETVAEYSKRVHS